MVNKFLDQYLRFERKTSDDSITMEEDTMVFYSVVTAADMAYKAGE